MNIVVATQRPWGVVAFRSIARPGWTLVESPDALKATCEQEDPAFVFLLHWSAKVPKDIHERWICVNFHCTPLPYGRGGSPIENMIQRGHATTVLTAHRMTAELDAGPVYGSLGPIGLFGSYEDITDRFVYPAIELMTWIVREQPAARPQEGEVVVFKRQTPEEREAFWAARRAL